LLVGDRIENRLLWQARRSSRKSVVPEQGEFFRPGGAIEGDGSVHLVAIGEE
jgi:hypothetical protein